MAHTSAFIILYYLYATCCNEIASNVSTCPGICKCKWKNGKQTVECVKQRLNFVPAGLDAATLVIDLSINKFIKLGPNIFYNSGLINLQKIIMVSSEIGDVDPRAFYRLYNIVEIDLSHNTMIVIPAAALKECPHLRRLQLQNNEFTYIGDSILEFLKDLKVLDLSNNKIEHIHSNAFKGLDRLKDLQLDGNRLQTITQYTLHNLDILTNLRLQNNPWKCDCRIREVREWMIHQNIPLEVPPDCEEPVQFKGIGWNSMLLNDFACPPVIFSPLSQKSSVVVGQNATLECNIDAIPKAKISWEVQGRSIEDISQDSEYHKKYRITTAINNNPAIQSSFLTVVNPVKEDSTYYTCIAENNAGNITVNYTLFVLPPSRFGQWGTTHAYLLFIAIASIVLIGFVVIILLILRPSVFSMSAKFRGVTAMKLFRWSKHDEESDCANIENEETSFKDDSKTENESLDQNSDQLTPDLVSRIAKQSHTSSMASTTISDTSPEVGCSGTNRKTKVTFDLQKFDHTPRHCVYSEIFPNPCFGIGATDVCLKMPTSVLLHPEFQADSAAAFGSSVSSPTSGPSTMDTNPYLIRSINGSVKHSPLAASSNMGIFSPSPNVRFSPDEGYDEDNVEATSV